MDKIVYDFKISVDKAWNMLKTKKRHVEKCHIPYCSVTGHWNKNIWGG